MLWVLALLAAGGGSDFQTTLKNATGADFWLELVPGERPLAGHSAAIVEAQVDTVAAILRDLDHYKEIFPQMTDSRVLSRLGRIVNAHIAVVIIGFRGFGRIPLVGDIRQVEQGGDGGALLFHQRTLGPSDFKRFEIDVRLTPLAASKCLVELWGRVIPDIPLIPDGLLEDEDLKLVRRGVRAIRLRAAGAKFDPNDL